MFLLSQNPFFAACELDGFGLYPNPLYPGGVRLAIKSSDARNEMINELKDKLLEFILDVLPEIDVPPYEHEDDDYKSLHAT